MTIGSIITARSTSSRYPRKHLGLLGGKPMIVQIINKLKKLSGLDYIILATTDKDTDDELSDVAMDAGAYIVRGPEYNILEREFMAINQFELDAVVPISGDCPFISNEYMQILIDAVRAEPGNYDVIDGLGNLSPMAGLVASIQMKSAYYKYESLMEKYPGKYSYEQYWFSSTEEPDLFKTLKIDTSEINPPEISPMKMSIDWQLEMLFWNKVIEWLGFYPEKIEDFNKAFRGMTEL